MKITYQEFINNILNTRGRFACGDEYHETHHIVPKCMDGSNDNENLIDLFAREHFEAHRLLALENPDNVKLTHAWWMMSTMIDDDKRQSYITAEEYEESRIAFSNAMTGENNPMYGKPSPMRGTHLSNEQKQHLRELNLGDRSPKYGRPVSSATRAKMREAQLGKRATDEARLNMRNAHLGKNMGREHHGSKPVARYDLDGNFIDSWDCIADVSRQCGINHVTISRACKYFKSAGGYQFRYIDGDIQKKISPYINQMGKYQIKPVARCDEDWNIIDIWNGYSAASYGTGIARSGIRRCCNGQQEFSGGYRWKILDENYEQGSTTN